MIKPRLQADLTSPLTRGQIENVVERMLEAYRHTVDAKIPHCCMEGRISETHGMGREIIGMLPRVREVVAEQEAATLRTRAQDDQRFSKILDIRTAAINVAIGSINEEIREINRAVTRLQMRKKKKKS